MSTQTPSPAALAQQARNERYPIQVEQFVCINESCQANVPQSHVISDYAKFSRHGIRTITTVCPACTAVARAPFVLRDGRWQLHGNVEPVTNVSAARAARRRVDQRIDMDVAQSA